MSAASRKAQAKLIGEDVEELVAGAVDGLRLVDDDGSHYDAVTASLLTPTPVLAFGSICLLEAGTRIEIKACRQETSNGPNRSTPGRWFFKGRDTGQHDHLLEKSGAYLLAVYRKSDGEREIVRMLLVPASIVDELLDDSWYDTGRREGHVAKLAWTTILEGEA